MSRIKSKIDIQRTIKMSATCKEKIINRYQTQDDADFGIIRLILK